MHSQATYKTALDLVDEGLNDVQVGRRLGVPRSTVRDWRRGRSLRPSRSHERCSARAAVDHSVTGVPESYAYLLAMYLGDGCIDRTPRTWRLRIFLDARWPGIVAECRTAMKAVLPANRTSVCRPDRRSNGVVASIYSQQLPHLFPQHGPGNKHLRTIELSGWQQQIVADQPRSFLRGLVHSDGCRFINRVRRGARTYAYPRYNFTNASGDIRALFTSTCDALGVECRPRGLRDVSVARSASVAILDEFIGPKY